MNWRHSSIGRFWHQGRAAGLITWGLIAINPDAAGVTIQATLVAPGDAFPFAGDPAGSSPSSLAGGGALTDVLNTAAKVWESAILDPFTVHISFGWADLGSGVLATAQVDSVFAPNVQGVIRFNNSALYPWFADPTPQSHSEYQTFSEVALDLGGGVVNTGRKFTGAAGDAADRFDLLSIAKHEIGHVLGLLNIVGFEVPLVITEPRPHAGSEIATTIYGGGHIDPLVHPDAVMVPFFGPGERALVTGIDILGAAQISGWSQLNLNPYPALPDGGSTVLMLGLSLFLIRQRQTN